MRGRHPVQGTLDFTAAGRATALGFRVIAAAKFHDLAALFVFDHLLAFNDIGVLQTDFPAWRQTEKFAGRIFHEIILFNIQFAGKRQFARTHFRILRIVFRFQLFHLSCRIVVDDYFQRPQHSHRPGSSQVEVFTHAVLQQFVVNRTIAFGYANPLAEVAYRFRGKAASAQT